MTPVIMIKPDLPWDELPDDARRSRTIQIISVVIALLCALIIPNVKLPPLPRPAASEVHERVATMKKIELPKAIPLPPPPKPKAELPSTKPVESKPAEKPPEPSKKPAEVKEPPSKHATAAEINAARNKGQAELAKAGVADALAGLRDLQTTGVAMAKDPTTAGALQKDSGGPAGTSRKMIGSAAGAGSGYQAFAGQASSGYGGGVAGGSGSKGNYNMGVKGTKDMAGGLIGGNGVAMAGGGHGGKGKGDGSTEASGGIRSAESIRKVFDQNGARLTQAYQRALRDDPSMQGDVLLSLTIDPSGKVVDCQIVSSGLNNAELEAKLVAIVKGFNFGAGDVAVWKGKHKLNLLGGG